MTEVRSNQIDIFCPKTLIINPLQRGAIELNIQMEENFDYVFNLNFNLLKKGLLFMGSNLNCKKGAEWAYFMFYNTNVPDRYDIMFGHNAKIEIKYNELVGTLRKYLK